MLIYCFFTRGAYEYEAIECVKRFKKFNIDVIPILMDVTKPGHHRACLQRSIELNKLAINNPSEIVCLIDSDLYPKSLPIFDLYDNDIAVTLYPDREAIYERACAGITVWSTSIIARKALNDWAVMCLENKERTVLNEQTYLWRAISSNNLKVRNLGREYNCVDPRKDEKHIIEHTVASRLYKKSIGG